MKILRNITITRIFTTFSEKSTEKFQIGGKNNFFLTFDYFKFLQPSFLFLLTVALVRSVSFDNTVKVIKYYLFKTLFPFFTKLEYIFVFFDKSNKLNSF